MFKHFLITRFNLRLDFTNDIAGSRRSSEAWLTNRFKLFNKFCWPSVYNQENKNFSWLVFFDIDTPQKFLDRIKILESQFENFQPVFIDGAGSFNKEVIRVVKEGLEVNDEFVITSRLDNDDAIHKSYIATVQKCFNNQDYCYIDMIKGYSLLYAKRMKLARINKPYNPFSTLIEKKSDKITTISTREHSHWEFIEDKILIKKGRLWIQLIHEKNLSNQFGYKGYLVSGGFLTNDYQKLEEFNINVKEKRKLNRLEVLFYNIRLFFTFILKFIFSLIKNIYKRI